MSCYHLITAHLLRRDEMKMMIGSKNPTKIGAVAEIFTEYKVVSLDVPSEVAAQPLTDEQTRQGAINRAWQCLDQLPQACGIGLEGGVMHVGEAMYLCNWGALVTPEKQLYTASGARILLPDQIAVQLQAGMELGEVMDQYAKKNAVGKNEGTIGIFTNNHVSRQAMFVHVCELLRGQREYRKKEAAR